MLELRKIKPIGCQVLVTKNLYGFDDYDESHILRHQKGDLKSYQQVIAVGDDVKFLKPGDTVEINFYKYAEFANDPNSIKVNGTNKVITFHLNIVEMIGEDNEPVDCILIDWRDIKYILKDFKEVTYNKKDELIVVKQPKKQLILPNNKIKV